MTRSELRQRLFDLENARQGDDWPGEMIDVVAEAGCFRSVIPERFGGCPIAPAEQIGIYEDVAAGSFATALILTQHDGACELIACCDNDALAADVLPRVARGEVLATVGISQLTTSRRGPGPLMTARRVDGGFRLDGLMPWVTSSPRADYIVTGGVLDDGLQILACVERTAPGVIVAEPMRFAALTHSHTGEIRCEGVEVNEKNLMRGPVERALALRAAVKPLSVSAVGMGLAGALIGSIRDRLATTNHPFQDVFDAATAEYEAVRSRLYAAADSLSDPAAELPSMEIRVTVNALLTRLAATNLTLAKGSGYRVGHPAQRLAREAMFFLVWSAPPQVQQGTMRDLWNLPAAQAT